MLTTEAPNISLRFCTNAGNCAGDFASIHYLAANEYLSTIAQICSITTMAVIARNPQITNPNVVFAGLPVCVPPGCCALLKCSNESALGPPDVLTGKIAYISSLSPCYNTGASRKPDMYIQSMCTKQDDVGNEICHAGLSTLHQHSCCCCCCRLTDLLGCLWCHTSSC